MFPTESLEEASYSIQVIRRRIREIEGNDDRHRSALRAGSTSKARIKTDRRTELLFCLWLGPILSLVPRTADLSNQHRWPRLAPHSHCRLGTSRAGAAFPGARLQSQPGSDLPEPLKRVRRQSSRPTEHG